jgi:hypothetical protein
MDQTTILQRIKLAYDSDRNSYLIRKTIKAAFQREQNQDVTGSYEMQLIMIEASLFSGDIHGAQKHFNQIKDDILSIKSDRLNQRFSMLQGQLLLMTGHVIEALEVYDNALHVTIENEDEIFLDYLRISQEMALIHFYEPKALEHLNTLLAGYQNKPTSWMKSSIAALYMIGCYRLKNSIDQMTFQYLKLFIDEAYPGPYVLFYVSYLLLDSEIEAFQKPSLEHILHHLLRTQGIKGDVLILIDFHNRFQASLEKLDAYDAFMFWMKRHVFPLYQKRIGETNLLFNHLNDEPKMSMTSCLHCDNRCCYDGVYVTYAEEEVIRKHMADYPEDFTHVPSEFLEKGEWEFLFGGKRTLRVGHEYTREDYPKHFEKTICVFALQDGSCSLQVSAIKHQMHPWRIKPELCWEFPLIGLFNEDAINHPHYFDQPDPHYFDESQPGYLSFLPCSKTDPEGISWKKLYKNELQYFLTKKASKKK